MSTRITVGGREELDTLADERDQLLESIEDLEREHDAGDLSDSDYALLRDRYTARTAEVLKALSVTGSGHSHETTAADGQTPTPPTGDQSSRAKRRRKKTFATIAVVLFTTIGATGAVLLARGTSSRLPGEGATGSVSLSHEQQLRRTLSQAAAAEAQGNGSEALALYDKVLQQDPTQITALSETGWLEFEAGVEAKSSKLLSEGQSVEEQAAAVDPGAYSPHLYLGSMFLVEGDAASSVSQFRLFISENPPASVLKSAVTFIDRAFAADHLTPPNLPSGS